MRECFVLPIIDYILPRLTGASSFTILDAARGFGAMPLHLDSAKLTTIIAPFGKFCFNHLQYGITNAQQIFQMKMHELLCNQEGVEVFLDDILVYGKDMEEHDN